MKNISLEAFFQHRKDPAHCAAKDVRATNRPILKVTSMVQQQINVYRDLLLDAEIDPEYDENHKGMLKALHATFDGLDEAVRDWQRLGRRVNDLMAQLERQLHETEGNIQAYEDAGGAEAIAAFRDRQLVTQADFRAIQLVNQRDKVVPSPDATTDTTEV